MQPAHRLITLTACLGLLYGSTLIVAIQLQPMPAEVLVLTALLAAILIALSLHDLVSGLLPDYLTLPLIAAGLLAAWWFQFDSLTWRTVSAFAGGVFIVVTNLVYRFVRGTDGIGYGDAKLLAASGAWLGLTALPTVLLWACATGLSLILVRAASSGEVSGQSALMFGPHLAFGTWLVWLFGAIG